jgi:hypothetical protein
VQLFVQRAVYRQCDVLLLRTVAVALGTFAFRYPSKYQLTTGAAVDKYPIESLIGHSYRGKPDKYRTIVGD